MNARHDTSVNALGYIAWRTCDRSGSCEPAGGKKSETQSRLCSSRSRFQKDIRPSWCVKYGISHIQSIEEANIATKQKTTTLPWPIWPRSFSSHLTFHHIHTIDNPVYLAAILRPVSALSQLSLPWLRLHVQPCAECQRRGNVWRIPLPGRQNQSSSSNKRS